jgi:WD40 repeat protein
MPSRRRVLRASAAVRRAALSWAPNRRRSRHIVELPVVLAVRGGGRAILATLTLRCAQAGPPDDGLLLRAAGPEPKADEEFRDSIVAARAWALGQSGVPRNGTVTWTITHGGKPLADVEGGSAGAAFAVGLAYLFVLTKDARRRPDDRVVVSAAVTGSGLLGGVGSLDDKVPVVGERGLRLVVATADHERARDSATAGRPAVDQAQSVPEAVSRIRLRRSRLFATSALTLALFVPIGGWLVRVERDGQAVDRARTTADIEQRSAASAASSPDQAIRLALRAKRRAPGDVAARSTLLAAVYTDPRLRRAIGGPGLVRAMSYSPDGNTLAVARDRSVVLYDPAGGREIAHTGRLSGNVTALTSGTGRARLLIGTDAGEVLSWNGVTATAPGIVRTVGDRVDAVALSPDGRTAAWAAGSGGIEAGPIDRTRAPVRVADAAAVTSASFVSGSKLVVGRLPSAVGSPALQVYDLSRPGTVRALLRRTSRSALMNGGVTSLAVVPARNLLVSGGADARLRLWDATTLKLRRTIRTHAGIDALSLAADGRTALVSLDKFIPVARVDPTAADVTVEAFDLDHSTSLGVPYFAGTSATTSVMALGPLGGQIAIATAAGCVTLWRPAARPDPAGAVNDLVPDPAVRDSALTLFANGDVVRVDARTGRRTVLFHANRHGEALAMRLDPAGTTMAIGHADGTVSLWSYPAGRPLRLLRSGRSDPGVVRMAFAPDGRTLAAGDQLGATRLWDTATTGAPVQVIDTDHVTVAAIAFNGDGSKMLVSHRDGGAKLFTPGGQPLHETRYPTDAGVVLRENDHFLAGFGDGTIARLDDALTVRELLPVRHTANVLQGAISADVRTIATAGADHHGMVIDLPSRRSLIRIPSPDPEAGLKAAPFFAGSFLSVTFTSSGGYAVFGTTEGHLETIALDRAALVAHACEILAGGSRQDGCG